MEPVANQATSPELCSPPATHACGWTAMQGGPLPALGGKRWRTVQSLSMVSWAQLKYRLARRPDRTQKAPKVPGMTSQALASGGGPAQRKV